MRRSPADPAAIGPELWDASLAEAPSAPQRRTATSRRSLTDLKRFGLALVEGLGDDPEAGVAFGISASRPIRETYFGRIFEVYTHPKPNSLAYTAHALAPHTDLPLFRNAAGRAVPALRAQRGGEAARACSWTGFAPGGSCATRRRRISTC